MPLIFLIVGKATIHFTNLLSQRVSGLVICQLKFPPNFHLRLVTVGDLVIGKFAKYIRFFIW